MNNVLNQMLTRYAPVTVSEYTHSLREILQEIVLLGLWRGKFFEQAAFYGGSALRILYGLDRYSEDLDFSLIKPDTSFQLSNYMQKLEQEVRAFGFDVQIELRDNSGKRPIQVAIVKTNLAQALALVSSPTIPLHIHPGKLLKIKLEVDTCPPQAFRVEFRHILQPIPFAVRMYSLPDLFAGKMHAVLCRQWKHRVKGRDWYDLVWYIANQTPLHLEHLESRLRQSGDWSRNDRLSAQSLEQLLALKIDGLEIQNVRRDVEPFIKSPEKLAAWSKTFFHEIITKIQFT
ncbi:MAG: nucleotidyl transferase AbiEii/AbiGii toxin family protein [FCB group bacterium]|nr:nucleotidyl transferase AbiEii/AbiGii toxin family protein [FCB group bacterium]